MLRASSNGYMYLKPRAPCKRLDGASSPYSQPAEKYKRPSGGYTPHVLLRARCFFFEMARQNEKNHRPYNPATGRWPPLRGFIRTVIFFGAAFFGGARAKCRTPYIRHASLASCVELSTSALSCQILLANVGCETFASNSLDKVCGALAQQGVHPKSCLRFFCADNFARSAARDARRDFLGKLRMLKIDCYIFATVVL